MDSYTCRYIHREVTSDLFSCDTLQIEEQEEAFGEISIRYKPGAMAGLCRDGSVPGDFQEIQCPHTGRYTIRNLEIRKTYSFQVRGCVVGQDDWSAWSVPQASQTTLAAFGNQSVPSIQSVFDLVLAKAISSQAPLNINGILVNLKSFN